MASNAKPLLLRFKCVDDDKDGSTQVLLKKGDDIRKDSGITLMFHIMNAIWHKSELKTTAGIDIHARTYQCVPFGKDFGLIEFVPNCTAARQMDTIPMVRDIMKSIVGNDKYENMVNKGSDEYVIGGGTNNKIDENTESNLKYDSKGRTSTVGSRDELSKQKSYDNLEEAKKKFQNELIASAAGSYIASYVLGVRDRHDNNILINQKTGTLFHIDFGYIMGEELTGIDAPPFAMTQSLYNFITARSENDWNLFVDYCVNAFKMLRTHHMELLDYVKVAFGFLKDNAASNGKNIDPEGFLKTKLMLDKSPSEAIEALRDELKLSPKDVRVFVKNTMNRMSCAIKN